MLLLKREQQSVICCESASLLTAHHPRHFVPISIREQCCTHKPAAPTELHCSYTEHRKHGSMSSLALGHSQDVKGGCATTAGCYKDRTGSSECEDK